MLSTKNVNTLLFAAFALALIGTKAHAETALVYAAKIVRNCDYQTSLKKPLEKSFTSDELRTLRIAISVDETICNQTDAYLTGGKVSRKASQRFVHDVVRTHQDAFDEAAATD